MLSPSTHELCARSSEQPPWESWRVPMPQGQQPAWGQEQDRLQSRANLSLSCN